MKGFTKFFEGLDVERLCRNNISLKKEKEIMDAVKNLYLAGANLEDFTIYIRERALHLYGGSYVFRTCLGELTVKFMEELKDGDFIILPTDYKLGNKHCRCCGKEL